MIRLMFPVSYCWCILLQIGYYGACYSSAWVSTTSSSPSTTTSSCWVSTTRRPFPTCVARTLSTHHRHVTITRRGRRTIGPRFYQDEGRGRGGRGDESISSRSQTRHRMHTIPVLGPLPGCPPLLIGADLVWRPIAMQWQALEEATYAHEQFVARATPLSNTKNGAKQDQEQSILEATDSSTRQSSAAGVPKVAASCLASPLIAILDDFTGGNGSGGRYATIAAVVGCRRLDNNVLTDNESDMDSFMESLRQGKASSLTTRDRQVRLLGVGRALLTDFFFQVSSALQNSYDEEGHLMDEHGNLISDQKNRKKSDLNAFQKKSIVRSEEEDNVDEGDENWDDDDDVPTGYNQNVLMAEFRLLTDGPARANGRLSSPVHAVAEMSRLAGQIQWTHQERRKLVNGIVAGKARLSAAGAATSLEASTVSTNDVVDWEVLEDYDGLGMLFSRDDDNEERSQIQEMINEMLFDNIDRRDTATKASTTSTSPTKSSNTDAVVVSIDNTMDRDSSHPNQGSEDNSLALQENYGLGYTAASFSDIGALTQVWLGKLEPYYSPTRRDMEEHYYEVYSYVAVLAMDKYLQGYELGWTLQCTNTAERMERVYDWMLRHVTMLKEEVHRISEQLRDCGEECTDLW